MTAIMAHIGAFMSFVVGIVVRWQWCSPFPMAGNFLVGDDVGVSKANLGGG